MPTASPLGTRRTNRNGYIMVKVTTGQRKRNWQFEHRLVWEATNGPLADGVVLHHLNGIKTDNRIENLAALSPQAHNVAHSHALAENGRRVGLSNRGKPKPPEQRAKIAAANKGKPKSLEHRAKLAESVRRFYESR